MKKKWLGLHTALEYQIWVLQVSNTKEIEVKVPKPEGIKKGRPTKIFIMLEMIAI